MHTQALNKAAYRVEEFAELHGIGRSTAYREIAEGRLRIVKLGRRTLVPVDAIRDWLAALPGAAAQSGGSKGA